MIVILFMKNWKFKFKSSLEDREDVWERYKCFLSCGTLMSTSIRLTEYIPYMMLNNGGLGDTYQFCLLKLTVKVFEISYLKEEHKALMRFQAKLQLLVFQDTEATIIGIKQGLLVFQQQLKATMFWQCRLGYFVDSTISLCVIAQSEFATEEVIKSDSGDVAITDFMSADSRMQGDISLVASYLKANTLASTSYNNAETSEPQERLGAEPISSIVPMQQMFASMIKNINPEMNVIMSQQFSMKISPEDAAKAQAAMTSLSLELDRNCSLKRQDAATMDYVEYCCHRLKTMYSYGSLPRPPEPQNASTNLEDKVLLKGGICCRKLKYGRHSNSFGGFSYYHNLASLLSR